MNKLEYDIGTQQKKLKADEVKIGELIKQNELLENQLQDFKTKNKPAV